jgi:sterol desaturase/sphingolipid hydroxylase (fatty acid hydroxylase superfamily)
VAGYASYLCVHYSVHAFPPPKNFLKHLWIHHALHHYQQPHSAYGVSSPFWDFIFRTMPEKKNFNVKTKTGYIDDRAEVSNP